MDWTGKEGKGRAQEKEGNKKRGWPHMGDKDGREEGREGRKEGREERSEGAIHQKRDNKKNDPTWKGLETNN